MSATSTCKHSHDTFIDNDDPTTLKRLSQHRIATEADIQSAVAAARKAGHEWKRYSLSARRRLLREIRLRLMDRLPEMVDTICRDTGKVQVEALMADIYPVFDLLSYYEKNLARFLSPVRRSRRWLPPQTGWVEYAPRGVVAVIAPWNYPFQLAMVPIITALAAGNTVILKPSEITPLVGERIEALFQDLSEVPNPLVQVIHGGGAVGEALIKNEPELVFFTGSVATGKKVMGTASASLIPVILELGGKDPFIVLEDAHVARAAAGAVYAAFANTGQLCISAERVYVHEAVAAPFLEYVKAEIQRIRVDTGRSGDIGPLTDPEQKRHVQRQIQEALDAGAEQLDTPPAVAAEEGGDPPNRLNPKVLTRVDHHMAIMKDETFGPVMPVMTFSHDEEAIEMANDSSFGLNASIWSRDLRRAQQMASELVVGSCSINDVIKNVGNPKLPFGGVKHSGIGRVHGPEGLRNLSQTKSISLHRWNQGREVNWFPFDQTLYEDLIKYLNLAYGKTSRWSAWLQAPGLIRRLFGRMKPKRSKR